MEKIKANLSPKDEAFRNFALTGNLWSVFLHVGIPLALYQSLSQLFKILDSLMAAHVSAKAVSAVAYLSQINLTLSAIGEGLAIGSSLKISEAYGAGDYQLVKSRISTLFGLCTLLAGMVMLLIPFTTQFLQLANTPPELIHIGKQYFILELIGLMISFFNNIYIAVERARGNSKRILHLNFCAIVVKLSLTTLFVYVFNLGITMIAFATIISQLIILTTAFINMRQADNAFGFSMQTISFKKNVVAPMISLSIPVMAERIAFSFGKVIVNSMSTVYGTLTVGALGISNNISGMINNPQTGFKDGGAAIISQNLGAQKTERALEVFKRNLITSIIIGTIGHILTIGFLGPISSIFANGDMEFAKLISTVYFYEAIACIPLGINSANMALLYGFGYTKLTLIINFSRVLIFRVPILWALQHFTSLGSMSVGIVMSASNILTAVLSSIIVLIVIRQICKENNIHFIPKKPNKKQLLKMD